MSTQINANQRGKTATQVKLRNAKIKGAPRRFPPNANTPGQKRMKAIQNRPNPRTLNIIGENVKQAKADPRLGSAGIKETMTLASVQRSIVQNVPMSVNSLVGFAFGYVSNALQRGFTATAPDYWYPSFAFNYLVGILSAYANNAVPQAVQLPKIVLAVGRSLTTKVVGHNNGSVSYSFLLTGSAGDGPNFTIGYTPYGLQYTLGYVAEDPGNINSFPVLTTTGFPAYDAAAGAVAFASMNTFLAQQYGENSDYKMVSIETPTVLDRDVSAYCYGFMPQGLGSTGIASGGAGLLVASEVPIHRPLLSLMSQNAIYNGTTGRYAVFTVNVTGDSTLLGAFLGKVIPLNRTLMKRNIKVHEVDFNEFLEVSIFWIQSLQQAWCNDNTNISNVGGSVNPSSIVCPLTLQEVSLLLRNVLMDLFKDTQAGVQGLYSYVPNGSTDNQFAPYTAHAGTCFLQSVGMSLPTALVENMRALVYRHCKMGKKDYQYFVPILGAYIQDTFNSTQYTYVFGDQNFPCFTIPTLAAFQREEVSSKTGKLTTVLAPEIPISLFDGSSAEGFAAINNPMALKNLAQTWEAWLTNSGLSVYSAPLCQPSTEPGINVLFSTNMTRHWITNSADRKRHMPKSTRLDPRRLTAVNGPYSQRLAIADTAQSIPLSVPYEDFQSFWILPTIENEFTGQDDSSVVTRWQALMDEPFLANSSSGYDGVNLQDLHSAYASKLVRPRNAPPNSWDESLQSLAAKGRGGILSSLVGGALNMFVPGVGTMVETALDAVHV